MIGIRGTRSWWLLGVMLASIALNRAAAEELAPPQIVIRDTADRLQALLSEGRQRLISDPAHVYRLADDVFVPQVDMDQVSRLVLGRYWRNLTEGQRQDFSREFTRLLARTYTTALQELGDWKLRFLPLRMHPGDEKVLVQTEMLRPGAPPLAVDYSMHRHDGRWLAYDIKIEGVSLITNYRAGFARVIQLKGFSALIDELTHMNDQRTLAAPAKVARN